MNKPWFLLVCAVSVFFCCPVAWAGRPNYTGLYTSNLSMTSDSCLDASPSRVQRALTVTHHYTPKEFYAGEIINEMPVRYDGKKIKTEGFRMTRKEVFPDITHGTCTYTDIFTFQRVRKSRAKLVNYVYSEKCIKDGRTSWSCRAKYKGRASRAALPW